MTPERPSSVRLFDAPLQPVTTDDGRSIELRELYAERPLALVFLRHLACIFCREIVTTLSKHPDLNIAFVAMERAETLHEFRRRMECPHPMLSDPTRALYDAFGLGHARMGQIVNPHTIRRGVVNLRAGLRNGVPTADPFMLGGAFAINREGAVVWEYRSRDAADNPTTAQILNALEDAAVAPEGALARVRLA